MAKAKKLPSGSWRVNQYVGINPVDGKRTYKSFTAETKKEAEFLAAQYALTQKDVVRAPQTVAVAMQGYINNKSAILSPSTIVGYQQLLRNAYPSILHVRLSSLTKDMVQRAINEYASTHSPKSTRNASGFLSAVLDEYAPEFNYSAKLPQKVKSEITIPTEMQIKKLLEDAEGTPMHTVYMLASMLGLRRSEIAALRWADVDLIHGMISINKATVQNNENEWVDKAPKSFAGKRLLSMPQVLIDELNSLPQRKHPDDLVVGLTPNVISDRFKWAKKRLGFSFRLHDLRHYTASIMLALGVPDKYAMERMGHATPNMLKNVYQHTMAKKTEEISETLNQFFDKL